MAVVPVIVPSPAMSANATGTPETAVPERSRTTTVGDGERVVPATADPLAGVLAVIETAMPALGPSGQATMPTGVAFAVVPVAPVPSWPKLFWPQQYRKPLVTLPQSVRKAIGRSEANWMPWIRVGA